MPRFPIEYAVEVHKNDGSPMELAAGDRPRLIVGPPPEFDGSDVWWSPEHLLVSALASCMTATFYAAAAHATLRIGAYRCRAHGILDHVDEGIAFASMRLAIDVTVVADDVERVRALLARAKNGCFVANSLRCSVELTVEVTAS